MNKPVRNLKPDARSENEKSEQELLALEAQYCSFGDTVHYVDARTGVPASTIAAELRAFLASRGFADALVEPTPPTVEDSFIARMGVPEGTRAA